MVDPGHVALQCCRGRRPRLCRDRFGIVRNRPLAGSAASRGAGRVVSGVPAYQAEDGERVLEQTAILYRESHVGSIATNDSNASSW